jgi:transcription initiation factor TFIIIB Brf1 subunit/transcription initiation factor TFIIB
MLSASGSISIDVFNPSDMELFDLNEDNMLDLIDSMDSNKSISIEYKSKTTTKYTCIGCDGKNLVQDYSKGCVKCIDCGICSTQIFDENPEWSLYEDGKGEGSVRCGPATNFFLPKSSLGTTISGKGYSVLKMLQTWNQMPYKERSLSDILQHLEQVCKKNNLPKSVIDNVKILYKQIHDLKYETEEKKDKSVIIRGDNRTGIYGACVYYGAQLQGYSRQVKEIATMLSTTIKVVTKGIRKFNDLMKKNNLINTISSTTPNDHIERFCQKLKLKKEQVQQIKIISNNITKLYLASNHQPTSIAAGAILVYSNIYGVDIQKKTISEIFEISNVTIDKIYRKILPFRKVIVSDEMTTFVKNKLMDAKYIMVNEAVQDQLRANAEVFKQNIIELSETSSTYSDLANETETSDIIVVPEKKKRGRKPKSTQVSNEV